MIKYWSIPHQVQGRGGDIAIEANTQGLLNIREAARLLNVHPNSVRRWSDLGLIRTYRIGVRGDRRFKLDDVNAFLEAQQSTVR